MARTIVYDPVSVQMHYQDEARPLVERSPKGRLTAVQSRDARKRAHEKTTQGEAPSQQAQQSTVAGKDDYLSKIAKYVPAETITLMTLLFAAFKPHGGVVWWWVLGGALVNVVYLFGLASQQTASVPMPPAYFYVLSVGAFFLWSMAAVNAVQIVAHVRPPRLESKQGALLALAAFIIPALDQTLSTLEGRKRGATRG